MSSLIGRMAPVRGRRLLIALSIAAVLQAGIVTPVAATSAGAEGIDFSFPTGFTVSGTITDASDIGVAGIAVGVCTDDPTSCGGSVTTAADGTFTIHGVVAGTYFALANGDSPHNHLNTYYASPTSTTDPALATPFVVAGNTTGIDIKLATGFIVSGTVSDGVDPVADVEVDVNGTGSGGSTDTDVTGHFAVGGLAPGFFTVFVRPPIDSNFMPGPVDGGTVVEGYRGEQFEVSGDLNGKDVALVAGNTLSGNIGGLTRPARVVALNSAAGYSLDTAPNGDYQIPALWPDQPVQLLVEEGEGQGLDVQFPLGVYDGTTILSIDQSSAVDIDMSGGDVTGLNLSVPVTPSITGHLTGDDGLDVHGSINLCGDGGCASSSLRAGGSYAFWNLPNGAYTEYVVAFEHEDGYVTATGVSSNVDDADAIVVSGSDVTRDVVVPAGFTISGHISGPLGEPIANANVSASKTDHQFAASASTDGDGNYTIRGLSAGEYNAGADPPDGGDYVGTFWWNPNGNTTDPDEAGVIRLPAGAIVLSTSPADGATGVARTVLPSVTYSDSVDVSGATVLLRQQGLPVVTQGSVSYNDTTHTLTFRPRGRLHGTATFVFEVSGVTGLDGAPVENVSVSFTTRR